MSSPATVLTTLWSWELVTLFAPLQTVSMLGWDAHIAYG